ncbi:conserved hypothetical protein [Neospora caninum Liverpool]|uniref:Uncharacterized protein n=1 Tax=Neospora caninum (strain Liverpool) TaxID=572307 RepID=F0VNH2_NEOCL|nr:conserved hypothetical protein [Neospora caninum Liverpool]CBZ55268.1 conserved hypothetical protein [Neospora caninum Liverpool]CEL69998.1 TPA: hypothetical protein BN1204_056920 [Neospora caninum Liverpool]|eukprot:XP_003885296.1 conserved hypothetical protein [Neospora caninum Liverpool]
MRAFCMIGFPLLWASNCLSSGCAQRLDPYLREIVPPLPTSRQPSPFDRARQRLDNPTPPSSSARPSPGRLQRLSVPDNLGSMNEIEARVPLADGASWFRSRFYMKYPSVLPYTRRSLPKEHFLYLPTEDSTAPEQPGDTVMDATVSRPFNRTTWHLQ